MRPPRNHASAFLTFLAIASSTALASSISNQHLAISFRTNQPGRPLQVTALGSDARLTLRARAPALEFAEGMIGHDLLPESAAIERDQQCSRIVLSYPPQRLGQVELHIRTIFTLPGGLPLIRKHAEIRAEGPEESKLTLLRVGLLDESFTEHITFQMSGWQSYPIFGEQWFFGVEYPVAQAIAADRHVRLSHAPGTVFGMPADYRTRSAVIGLAPAGRVREAFEEYVQSFRPIREEVHFNYNSWWTSPVPFGEEDILSLIETFDEKVYRAHGVSLDSFTLDMGWSRRDGIWEIDETLFPNGFAPLVAALGRQQARLGLWWSPSNQYSPSSFDNHWAVRQGYETITIPRPNRATAIYACLGRAGRYQRESALNLSRLAGKYQLGQIKFDGYHSECASTNHGHLPGEFSRETLADGLIDILKDLRAVSPDTWMETTCFGYDASPWWLEHANSVIGPFGDDAPYGAVPAPVYRESYTTSRDFFNLRGSLTPVPIAAQEVLGIIHQTAEPMYNDAVLTVLRGHQFISLYLNPRFMSRDDYAFLAQLMQWTRANAAMLARTKVIWPAQWRLTGPAPVTSPKDMPRQSYAYAHWHDGEGLLCVRNPWVAADELQIGLDDSDLGVPAALPGRFAALQIYPWMACLAKDLPAGGRLRLRMGPYETKVIRIVPDTRSLRVTADPGEAASGKIRVNQAFSSMVEHTAISPETQPFGDDYTVVSSSLARLWQTRMEGTSPAECWMYWLVEGAPESGRPGEAEITINDKRVKPQVFDSETGWSAAQARLKQHAWKWYAVPLPRGDWQAAAEIELPHENATVSAWVFANADIPPASPALAAAAGDPPLPLPPGYIPTVSVEAIGLQNAQDLSVQKRSGPAIIERIDGVYLDRLEPTSVTQGWGKLQRNQSVWGRPMYIGTQRFMRGLGTHANSRITYLLNGQYKALHCYAGQDSATNGSITMEIHLDGRKIWDSGLLRRGDAPRQFSIELNQADELTLVVTDGGDNFHGDHANWADVWLENR